MGRDWRILTHAEATKESSSTMTLVIRNMAKNARHIVVSRPVSVTANTAPTVQMSDSIGTPTTKRLLS